MASVDHRVGAVEQPTALEVPHWSCRYFLTLGTPCSLLSSLLRNDVVWSYDVGADVQELANPGRYSRNRSGCFKRNNNGVPVAELGLLLHPSEELAEHRVQVEPGLSGAALRLGIQGLGTALGNHIALCDFALNLPSQRRQVSTERFDHARLITLHALNSRHRQDLGGHFPSMPPSRETRGRRFAPRSADSHGSSPLSDGKLCPYARSPHPWRVALLDGQGVRSRSPRASRTQPHCQSLHEAAG